MRSWYPIPVSVLDNKALLGEHNELHIMARSIGGLIKGWGNHPETKRWLGHTKFMKVRHSEISREMTLRGYNHKTPFPEGLISQEDSEDPPSLIEDYKIMYSKLSEKIINRKK